MFLVKVYPAKRRFSLEIIKVLRTVERSNSQSFLNSSRVEV